MHYLTAYDIEEDGRRSRIANILLDYGSRVQESVFFLDLDEELQERMIKRIKAVADETADIIWLVPVCSRCSQQIITMGRCKVPSTPEFWVL